MFYLSFMRSIYSAQSFSVLFRCSFNFYKYSFSISISRSMRLILAMGVLKPTVERDCDLSELNSIIRCQNYAKFYFQPQQKYQHHKHTTSPQNKCFIHHNKQSTLPSSRAIRVTYIILHAIMSLQKPFRQYSPSKPPKQKSLFKYYHATIKYPQSLPKQIPPSPKLLPKKSKYFLPSIHQKLHTEEVADLLQSRVQLQSTVIKLKSRHFAPQGASRTRKLQLIKSKRETETNNNSLRRLSKDRIARELAPFPSSKSQQIASCTLEESMLYG